MVDCTVFQNPDSKSELQKHIGAHPDIMHGVYSDPMFPEVHSVLRSLSLSGKNLVVCVQERRLLPLLWILCHSLAERENDMFLQ